MWPYLLMSSILPSLYPTAIEGAGNVIICDVSTVVHGRSGKEKDTI